MASDTDIYKINITTKIDKGNCELPCLNYQKNKLKDYMP